jgi:hypothetical protein
MSNRFISPCQEPNAYLRELLEILIEECAEVQQRATKMLRFGVEEIQPGQFLNNRDRLSLELGDLKLMVQKCHEADLLREAMIAEGVRRKTYQLAKYMQTSPP